MEVENVWSLHDKADETQTMKSISLKWVFKVLNSELSCERLLSI